MKHKFSLTSHENPWHSHEFESFRDFLLWFDTRIRPEIGTEMDKLSAHIDEELRIHAVDSESYLFRGELTPDYVERTNLLLDVYAIWARLRFGKILSRSFILQLKIVEAFDPPPPAQTPEITDVNF